MSDCNNSANAQLKAMSARLDRIDDDLIATYAGISQLVAGLATNPIVAPHVALSLKTFNFSSVGQKLLKKLVTLVPGYNTFRQLQHLDAAALVSNMAGKLESTISGMVLNAAEQAVNVVSSTIHAQAELAQALANGVTGEALQPFQNAVDNANALLASAPEQVQLLSKDKLAAQMALDQAIAQGVDGAALQPYLDAVANADQAISYQADADKAIGGFLTTLNDISTCRTRSSIIR